MAVVSLSSVVRGLQKNSACVVCLVALVCFVCLVDLVHLVSFVQPNKQNKPNKPIKRDSEALASISNDARNPAQRACLPAAAIIAALSVQ
jgi:hypothetical protein